MKRTSRSVMTWGSRCRFLFGHGLLLVSLVPVLLSLNLSVHGDVKLYESVARDTVEGVLPYRARTLEYPPYAIPVFLIPTVFGGVYSQNFVMVSLLMDAGVKFVLLVVGLRVSKNLRALLPLILYAVSVPALRYFYLQRYDIWPAALSILAIWGLGSRRFAWAGLALAVGIGVKLYPVVWVPPLLCIAWCQGRPRPFLTGLVGGLLPIALISPFLPWWEFLAFHGDRGLQVESLYASVLWMAHLLNLTELEWVFTTAWLEVKGPLAAAILPWTRLVFVGAVGFSTVVAVLAAVGRGESLPERPVFLRASVLRLRAIVGHSARSEDWTISEISRLLLIPLLAFIAFNQVLSPQFMIWLLPLAALASLSGRLGVPLGIVFATWLTPGFFPSPGYAGGLDLFETSILLYRNLLLVFLWAVLVWDTGKEFRCARQTCTAEVVTVA